MNADGLSLGDLQPVDRRKVLGQHAARHVDGDHDRDAFPANRGRTAGSRGPAAAMIHAAAPAPGTPGGTRAALSFARRRRRARVAHGHRGALPLPEQEQSGIDQQQEEQRPREDSRRGRLLGAAAERGEVARPFGEKTLSAMSSRPGSAPTPRDPGSRPAAGPNPPHPSRAARCSPAVAHALSRPGSCIGLVPGNAGTGRRTGWEICAFAARRSEEDHPQASAGPA